MKGKFENGESPENVANVLAPKGRRPFLPRSPLSKIIAGISVALATLEIVYVLGVSFFLSTPLFRKVLDLNPQELSLSFGFGWSLVPGFVYLDHVHLDGQDPNVHWHVEIPSAEVHISLLELREKKVHILHLNSPGGLKFKLSLKTAVEKAAYPNTPDTDTLQEKRDRRWRLKFDEVDLFHVESLEVANWLYQGGAEIHGGFALWPGVEAEVGPATLQFQSGHVTSTKMTRDAHPLLDHLDGTVGVHIEKFVTDEVNGSEVFKYLDLEAKASADVFGTDWINQTLIHRSNVQMTEGDGKLSLSAKIRRGIVQPGSRVDVDTDHLQLLLGRLSASGRGKFRTEVTGANLGEASAELLHFKIETSEKGHVVASGDRLEGRLRSSDLELTSFFARRTFELSVPKAVTEGDDNWASFVGPATKAFSVKPGAGTISIHLFAWDGLERAPADIRAGRVQVSLPMLLMGYGGATYRGAFTLDSDISPYDLANSEGGLRSLKWQAKDGAWTFPNASEADARVQAPTEELPHWWWNGEIPSLHVHFTPKLAVEGDVSLESKDDEPAIKFYRLKKDFAGWKAALLKQGPVKISSSVWKSKDELGLRNISLHAGPISAQGMMTFSEADTLGKFLFRYGILSLGVKLHHGQTETKILPNQQWIDNF